MDGVSKVQCIFIVESLPTFIIVIEIHLILINDCTINKMLIKREIDKIMELSIYYVKWNELHRSSVRLSLCAHAQYA